MPIERLTHFLDDSHIRYVTLKHSEAFTAQEIAASAHIPGQLLAKVVMVNLDGQMCMAVVPASYRVDLDSLAYMSNCQSARLATEEEFAQLFPNCEVGAMPPFGNLWNMKVYVSESLAQDERIYFNAGSHQEVITMRFTDYRRLAEPWILPFSAHM